MKLFMAYTLVMTELQVLGERILSRWRSRESGAAKSGGLPRRDCCA